MTTTVVGLFNNITEVNRAIHALKNHGFDLSQISLKTGLETASSKYTQSKPDKTETAAGIACGAISGATLGVLVGTIWGLSSIGGPTAELTMTAGTLVPLLTLIASGLGIGAVAGVLLLSILVKLGRSTEKDDLFTKGIKPNSVLVEVQTPEERVSEVKTVLHEAKAVEGSIV